MADGRTVSQAWRRRKGRTLELPDLVRVGDVMTAPALCVPEELVIDDC